MKVPVGGLPELAHAPRAMHRCCQPCKTYIKGPKGTSGLLARLQRPALRSPVAKVCISMYLHNMHIYTHQNIPNTCINTYQYHRCCLVVVLVCIMVCLPVKTCRYKPKYIPIPPLWLGSWCQNEPVLVCIFACIFCRKHHVLRKAGRGVGSDVLARIENVLSVLVCIDR